MERIQFRVNLQPKEAADKVVYYIERSAASAELLDRQDISNGEESLSVMVFEKYFMRNSSRASLTVTIENLNGMTNVTAVGSGGGQGAIFKFDWGASSSFQENVRTALKENII